MLLMLSTVASTDTPKPGMPCWYHMFIAPLLTSRQLNLARASFAYPQKSKFPLSRLVPEKNMTSLSEFLDRRSEKLGPAKSSSSELGIISPKTRLELKDVDIKFSQCFGLDSP